MAVVVALGATSSEPNLVPATSIIIFLLKLEEFAGDFALFPIHFSPKFDEIDASREWNEVFIHDLFIVFFSSIIKFQMH